ncbi:MAG: RNA 2'-phosphotransferase, partial [bacterium]|nr:RNA 2'-phosphotransferase [bacterium]
ALSVPAQLCTSTKVNVHRALANRAGHPAVSLLRHHALRDGLPLDDGGWALVFHVASRARVPPGTLIMLAAADDKGRFQLAHYAPNGVPSTTVLIRAKQGHSIANLRDDRLYVSPSVPMMHSIPVLRHATTYEPLMSIMREGIKPGGGDSQHTPSGGRRRQVHFTPFPVGDERVLSGARATADVHVYCNKWALHGSIPLWLSSSLAVLTTEEVPWEAIELVVYAKGALRRTLYDAALAPYPLDKLSDEDIRVAKSRRQQRQRATSRTQGPAGRGQTLTPRASEAQGIAGASPFAVLAEPMSEGEEGDVGMVLEDLSPEELAAQRRRMKEFERQQQGRASQSTRAGDWRANYDFPEPAASGAEEARSGSAAQGCAADRSRPQHRSGARSASPPRSPRSPTHSRA